MDYGVNAEGSTVTNTGAKNLSDFVGSELDIGKAQDVTGFDFALIGTVFVSMLTGAGLWIAKKPS